MDAQEIRALLGKSIFERAQKHRKRILQSSCTTNEDGVRHLTALVQGSGPDCYYTQVWLRENGSFVSASAAQQAWKAQAVAIHSYLEYHKQYGSSTNALIYTPVDQIPASARNAIRKAVQAVKDEVLVYNGSVCDAVWSASAGYNTQTGVYGTCASLDAWGTDVPYLQSVESPYEEQYHKLLRRVIGKDYTYIEYNDSRTGEPYQSADTTHKDLGGFVQYNTLVSNGRSYRYINQFVSSRYCFDFGTDAGGTPCMTYYGYGHGVGMSQYGAELLARQGKTWQEIIHWYYADVTIGAYKE